MFEPLYIFRGFRALGVHLFKNAVCTSTVRRLGVLDVAQEKSLEG
jgi:hypothetical protein